MEANILGSIFCAIGKALGGCQYADPLFSVYKAGNPSGNTPSPRYDIPENTIFIKNTVQNTNSMEPLIDIGHTILLSDDRKYLDNLSVGDIIIRQGVGQTIIHSIVEIGNDGEWYCRTQGLNVNKVDDDIVRLPDIKYVALGVHWTKAVGSYVAPGGD